MGPCDPDAPDVIIKGYKVIELQILKHFQPEGGLKAWLR